MNSFFGQELRRGLIEQGPVISGFELIDVGSLQAVARVKILEGHVLEVSLTQQGYKVEPLVPSYAFLLTNNSFWKVECKPNEDITQTFETIEDLLRNVSPLYVQRHSEMFFEALKQLS